MRTPPSPVPGNGPVVDPTARARRRAAVLRSTSDRTATTGPDTASPPGAVAGTVLDASPHLLVLDTPDGETRLPLSGDTRMWPGGRGGPAELRPDREVVVRLGGPGGGAARTIWVDACRVSGTITARARGGVDVDMGPHRGHTPVHIDASAFTHVQVRHPRLEPGYLFDAICVRTPDGPRAVQPATSQPPHPADRPPSPPDGAPVGDVTHGTATWFTGPPVPGAAYPAMDVEGAAGGCVGAARGCAALPLLSVGSVLSIRNECDGTSGTVPVIECGCVAALFSDRCTECGASPRGRLVELTPVAFAALGGNLEKGCFNVALEHDPGICR